MVNTKERQKSVSVVHQVFDFDPYPEITLPENPENPDLSKSKALWLPDKPAFAVIPHRSLGERLGLLMANMSTLNYLH